MKRIFKYQMVPQNSRFHMELPKGSKVLLVGPDPNGVDCMWVEFEAKQVDNLVPRTFEIFGTGHLVPPLSNHIISFRSGQFMWHLYDHGEALPGIGQKLVPGLRS